MNQAVTSDALALALLEIAGMFNSPRQDDLLLAEAGVSLDRALFPLLVRIGFCRSLTVAALAEQAGRDASTVSRQVAKLERLGLIQRQIAKGDGRAREASITLKGRKMVQSITRARRRLFDKLLADWSAEEVASLGLLNRRFADEMKRSLNSWVGSDPA